MPNQLWLHVECENYWYRIIDGQLRGGGVSSNDYTRRLDGVGLGGQVP